MSAHLSVLISLRRYVATRLSKPPEDPASLTFAPLPGTHHVAVRWDRSGWWVAVDLEEGEWNITHDDMVGWLSQRWARAAPHVLDAARRAAGVA